MEEGDRGKAVSSKEREKEAAKEWKQSLEELRTELRQVQSRASLAAVESSQSAMRDGLASVSSELQRQLQERLASLAGGLSAIEKNILAQLQSKTAPSTGSTGSVGSVESLGSLEKLDKLESLEKLKALDKLDKLSDLSKLDRLESLSKLNQLDRLESVQTDLQSLQSLLAKVDALEKELRAERSQFALLEAALLSLNRSALHTNDSLNALAAALSAVSASSDTSSSQQQLLHLQLTNSLDAIAGRLDRLEQLATDRAINDTFEQGLRNLSTYVPSLSTLFIDIPCFLLGYSLY